MYLVSGAPTAANLHQRARLLRSASRTSRHSLYHDEIWKQSPAPEGLRLLTGGMRWLVIWQSTKKTRVPMSNCDGPGLYSTNANATADRKGGGKGSGKLHTGLAPPGEVV